MNSNGILLEPNASDKSSVSGGTVTYLLQSDWLAVGNQIWSIAHQLSSHEVRSGYYKRDTFRKGIMNPSTQHDAYRHSLVCAIAVVSIIWWLSRHAELLSSISGCFCLSAELCQLRLLIGKLFAQISRLSSGWGSSMLVESCHECSRHQFSTKMLSRIIQLRFMFCNVRFRIQGGMKFWRASWMWVRLLGIGLNLEKCLFDFIKLMEIRKDFLESLAMFSFWVQAFILKRLEALKVVRRCLLHWTYKLLLDYWQ